VTDETPNRWHLVDIQDRREWLALAYVIEYGGTPAAQRYAFARLLPLLAPFLATAVAVGCGWVVSAWLSAPGWAATTVVIVVEVAFIVSLVMPSARTIRRQIALLDKAIAKAPAPGNAPPRP